MRVTVDTSAISLVDLERAAEGLGFELATTSVTERELGGHQLAREVQYLPQIMESFGVGESEVGKAKIASESESAAFAFILGVISNGAWPYPNSGTLSPTQRRQLRDAMIFAAHVRDGREIFVTEDQKAFVKDGRRDRLEMRFNTRIMTKAEFTSECRRLRHR